MSRTVQVLEAYQKLGSWNAVAKELGLSRGTIHHHQKQIQKKGLFEVAKPLDNVDMDELLARRKKAWIRQRDYEGARALIPVKVKIEGPIGIACFGDLHIDDDGCNWDLLERHIALVQNTEGLFAGSVGDLQNGWVGRLAYKWRDQSITGKEAWALVEWWIDSLKEKLIFISEGNHDAWVHTGNGMSPIDWIMSRNPGVSDKDGVRLAIDLDKKRFTVNCRHDFRGRSQWNAAHGGTKAAMMGWRDDLIMAGHTHESAYNVVKDPMSGKVSHVLRIASYKYIDDYARREGFPDNNIFECPVVIFDPNAKDQRYRVKVYQDPEHGADVLKFMRRKAA